MYVVGVTGYAQHGKDTFGNRLAEQHGFERVAFADQLRELAWTLNPYVVADAGQPNRYRSVVDELGYEAAKRLPEVRRVLQELGIGVRAVIGEDAWVQALVNRLAVTKPKRVVITDVRFPNEAAWVKAMRGTLVRITRYEDGREYDNGLGTDHESEAHVKHLPALVELANDGTDAFLEAIDKVFWTDEPLVTTEYEALVLAQGDTADTTPYERQLRYQRIDKLPPEEHLDAVRARTFDTKGTA